MEKIKIILVGYPGSQHIVPISRYLVEKYLPDNEVIFLNHKGDKDLWSKFVADYLETLDDEKIIFALDDYLLNGSTFSIYTHPVRGQCVKLCETTPEEHKEYPVTTQYTIWDRKLLISILRQTTSPWDFEMSGSKILKYSTVHTCIYYDVHSALSSRWEGINWNGVKEEDLTYIKNEII